MKLLARLFPLTVLVLILYACFWATRFLFSHTYDEFIDQVAFTLQKGDNWVPFFKARITENSFSLIKQVIIAVDVAAVLIAGLSVVFSKRILAACSAFFLFIDDEIKKLLRWYAGLPKQELYIFYSVLLFALVKALWYSMVIPIQYDEAWTYNYYISNELWQTVLLPSNNHKLYTFIAWWFNQLPFEKVFLIRLPNTITGLLLLVIFYYFAGKRFNKSVAFLGYVWLATCVPVDVYMTSARSYIYIILLTLLLLMVYSRIASSPVSRQHYQVLFGIVLLGYFSNPVFLYGHFVMSLFFAGMLIYHRQFYKIKAVLLSNAAVLPFLGLLYGADAFGGHFKGLLQTAYKPDENRNYFLDCIRLNADFQTGVEGWPILLMIVVSAGLLLSFKRGLKSKALLVYAILSIVWLPVLATIVHDDTSVHKTIYITISFTLLLMYIFQIGFSQLIQNKYRLAVIALLIAGINSFNLDRHSWFKWSTPMDNSVKSVAEVLLNNQARECYLVPYYYKPGIAFYHKIQQQPIQLYLKDAGSVDYDSTLFSKHDPGYVLTSRNESGFVPLQKYSLLYKDDIVALYKKREPEQ